MRYRCSRRGHVAFACYGARGISVCPEWAQSFLAFRQWALSNGYQENLEIDRIDVNGNYCPENCRWICKAQNVDNQRKTLWVTAYGERKTLMDWVRLGRSAVKRTTLGERIKRGWKPEDALTIPTLRKTDKYALL